MKNIVLLVFSFLFPVFCLCQDCLLNVTADIPPSHHFVQAYKTANKVKVYWAARTISGFEPPVLMREYDDTNMLSAADSFSVDGSFYFSENSYYFVAKGIGKTIFCEKKDLNHQISWSQTLTDSLIVEYREIHITELSDGRVALYGFMEG